MIIIYSHSFFFVILKKMWTYTHVSHHSTPHHQFQRVHQLFMEFLRVYRWPVFLILFITTNPVDESGLCQSSANCSRAWTDMDSAEKLFFLYLDSQMFTQLIELHVSRLTRYWFPHACHYHIPLRNLIIPINVKITSILMLHFGHRFCFLVKTNSISTVWHSPVSYFK